MECSINKFTKIAFSITDIISWVLIIVCVLASFGLLVDPKFSGWALFENSIILNMLFEVFVTLIHAFGFYLLIKRKILGFVLIVISTSIFWVITRNAINLYYLLIILMVFSGTWLAAYSELKK